MRILKLSLSCLSIIFLLALVWQAMADTIYLKNGRVIITKRAWIEGENVKYETSKAVVSVPKDEVIKLSKSGPPSEPIGPKYRFPTTVSKTPEASPAPAKSAATPPGPATRESSKAVAAGPMAADFTLPDESGQSVSLRALRGKVVLLDFWATWCGPCRQTMPKLQKLHQEYAREGLVVIGLNIEGNDETVERYIKSGGYTFKLLFDSGDWNSKTANAYKVHGIPQSFLIDKAGRIRYSGHPGGVKDALLKELLNE